MDLLNIPDDSEDYEESSVSSKRPLFIALGVLLSFLALGTTLASNIFVNTGKNTEFGQGVGGYSACSSSMKVDPQNYFKNDPSSPIHILSGFKISNVPAACRNKLFVIRAFDNVNQNSLNINGRGPYNAFKFHFDNSAWQSDSGGCFQLTNGIVNSSTNNSVFANINLCISTDPSISMNSGDSRKIYKFTVETKENSVHVVNINYTRADTYTIGEIYNYGFNTYDDASLGGGSLDLHVDTDVTPNFELFVQVPISVYGNNSLGPTYYNVTFSSGSSCTYQGFSDIGANARSPEYNFLINPLGAKAVEYFCTVKGDDNLTVS
jgi:hypothetical protein